MEYTKYEIARIIGARALQLSGGAPFTLDLSEKELERLRYDPLNIAKLEFEKGVIPIKVKRKSHNIINDDLDINQNKL